MGTLKKDFKYKIIKNFLTEEERKLLKNYTKMFHMNNVEDFDFKQNLNGDTCKYSDYLMESLMITKLHKVEKESNLELIPTYSFWRCYTKLADLKKHKDRPSCEVSVTCQIDSDGTDWPIYINGEPINLKNGDAALYWGTNVEHWRNEFVGDYHIQAFLHYVDKNGSYKDYAKDKRIIYGVQNENNTTT